MIVDVHAHLGWDHAFDEEFTAEELLRSQETNAIDKTIVQPGTCYTLEDVQRQHDAIASLVAKYPGRFYGMSNPDPHLPDEVYARELGRCVRDLGFVGVKIHPFAHAVNPSSQTAHRVAALAQELGIPVMVHTGSGIPWALPTSLIPLAQAHPDVSFVMAHSGQGIFAAAAALAAEQCPNVYLEVSWTGGFVVRDFVRRFGAHRVLFGSDHADNAATELTKFRTSGLMDQELEWCLGKIAASLYRL